MLRVFGIYFICSYLLIMEESGLIRVTLDGTRFVKMPLSSPTTPGYMVTLDHPNTYLYYLCRSEKAIYRVNYTNLDSYSQPQLLFRLSQLDNSQVTPQS